MAHSEYKDNRSAGRRVSDASRRTALRAMVGFLVLFGAVVIIVPFMQLAQEGSAMLWPDTRAWLRFGDADDVPTVHQVQCSAQQYGTGGLHPRAKTVHNCILLLTHATVKPVSATADPYAGLTKAQADSVYQQMLSSLASRPVQAGTDPTMLERALPRDMTGQLPVLRRLSAADAPANFGVVWGTGEILLRWLAFGLELVAFWGFGILCLVAARVAWRKAQR